MQSEIRSGRLDGVDCVSADARYTVGHVLVDGATGHNQNVKRLGGVNPFVRDDDGTVTG